MSTFRTVFEIPEFRFRTGYGQYNLFMGSCFTENIGKKLQELKYTVELNPFGILYNPVSILNGLEILLRERQFSKDDLFFYQGLWHSFFHHSRFSGSDADETLKGINDRIVFASQFLSKAGFLFITFGTARVYEWKETGKIVSNCHKIPANLFKEYRLSVGEIVEAYRDLLSGLWEVNPSLKVVFTVSPVRHWKDGAIENQRSKAVLLLAIDRLLEGFGSERCGYFPSYEIVMDELRDYRFYAEDMIHISDFAVNYIWERFEASLINQEDRERSNEIIKIVKASQHKPFNRGTSEYKEFLNKSLMNLTKLEKRYPDIDFHEEKTYFCNEINIIRNLNSKD